MTTAQMNRPAGERAKAPLVGSLKTKLAMLCAPITRASMAIDAALAAWLLVAVFGFVVGG
jgi:hypothetical protein